MKLAFDTARESDAVALASLRTAANAALTGRYGHGLWSGVVTEAAILRGMRSGRVLLARDGREIVGTLRLETRKPWAIKRELLTRVRRPLYLVDMAVAPAHQRRGVGRALLDHAAGVASAWPAELLALDAWDAPAGAGGFYAKCGFREVGRAVYRGAPLIYYELLLP